MCLQSRHDVYAGCARSLRAAKVQSEAFEQFNDTKRMTEWVLPTSTTVGQYVRIQLQKRNFLHVAEVEVFGVYSAFKTVGRVGAVHCTRDATLVVVPPTSYERFVMTPQSWSAAQSSRSHM